MIDLKPFYFADHVRSEIAAPFSDAEHTYATDGFIIIRVPLLAGVSGSKFATRADRLFSDHTLGREWLSIPSLPDAIMEPCSECEHGCSECDNGFVEKIKSVDVGGIPFQRKYLALLAALPNCRISPDGQNAAWFKFDGGDGLIMPMRCSA